MFKFVTGNILDSSADCLVNTVNCEGFMGKGISYQFKLQFPRNNKDYIAACKNGTLKIGTLHYFIENGKLIINFPTKDKWRANSKVDYIEKGLTQLITLIHAKRIKSIAIPPLGCGNGGLHWAEVKPIIIKHLQPLADNLDIYVYEPSIYFRPKSIEAPKLNASHLILMSFKPKLKKSTRLRLQKSAFFMNLFSGENYFKFTKYKFGPYAHSIDILIKDINAFKDFYKVDYEGAFKIANNVLISESVIKKLNNLAYPVEKATEFVNSIKTDSELELLSTICYILKEKPNLNEEQVIYGIKNWSEEKAKKFSDDQIVNSLEKLCEKRLIQKDLLDSYSIAIGK